MGSSCRRITLLWALLPLTLCATSAAAIQVRHGRQRVQVSTPRLRLDCDLAAGTWEVRWAGSGSSLTSLRGASCAARLSDGTALRASDYPRHECLPADVTPISDASGAGIRITLRHRAPGRPELRQHFRLYSDLPYFFIRLEIVSPTPVATNDIAPLLLDDARTPGAGLHLDAGGKPRTLFVPYDNDKWVRYNSDAASNSYEVTAVYDNTSRHGLVLGSVTHDLWKTGITMGRPAPRGIGSLRLYGGAASEWTHDTQAHGLVSGRAVASPLIFVGFFGDWRDGLQTYGRANARLQPPLAWSGGVPFGWNSWAAYKETVNDARCRAVSDFLKHSLQGQGFENQGTAYVNLDSYWDNLTEAQIRETVRHIHANGQKAGIYWTPFVCWGGDLRRPVEGSEGRYAYQDILLKDAADKTLPPLDGGLPLDPTHPGTLLRIDWQLRRFVEWGFDYVKLDFLSHGAREGAHFDRRITTGIAAYNCGMKRIVTALDPKRIGRPFFISLSIAPLFPSGYGHSRRISCDAFGAIGQTEYMLNSLTYGWWASGALYRYNDPDHMVLYQEHGHSPTTKQEGRSRLNASVIAGTVLLDSDDLTEPRAQERAARLLANREIIALARSGRTFRPVEGDTGARAADVFVRNDPATRQLYLALFNYSRTEKAVKALDLTRLGLDLAATYRVRDLWTRRITQAKGSLSVDLAPSASTILCLSKP